MKRHTPSRALRILLIINIIMVIIMIMSAYGGWLHPKHFSWLVSLTLFFPFLLACNAILMLIWLVAYNKRWLWSFCAIISCAPTIRTYCPINFPQPVPKGCIKVVSYNTYGMGVKAHDPTSFQQMADYLQHCDADILCAQETSYNRKYEQDIKKATSHWRYTDSVSLYANHSALTLYSNFPIISRRVIPSPSRAHICVVYLVKVNNDTAIVVNSHFVTNSINNEDKEIYKDIISAADNEHTKDDLLRILRKINAAGIKRATQADSLSVYLASLGDKPTIICGDFNDSPLSYTHTTLCRNYNDAYTHSGNGPGISYHDNLMYFRLDNILYSHHWKSFGSKVLSQHKMSDHYPIQTWLKRIK